MVLSNKKLKQKLRAQVAETLAASEPSKGATLQPQTFKTLLDSVTQKPRLSKREVRRNKLLSFGDSKPPEKRSDDHQKQNEDVDPGSEEKQRKKERKKRKRADAEEEPRKESGDGEDGVLTVERKAENGKKGEKKEEEKKKKKKKKKTKTKEKKTKNRKDGSESGSGESKEKGTTDSKKSETR